MSISSQPLSNPPNSPAKRVSITTLILWLALAVSTTAAIVLAVLYLRHPGSDDQLVQKDTVSPQAKYTGIVYYPVPYASPPSLKLTSAKRQYDIVKQDEAGFTWMALSLLEDIKDEWRKNFEAAGVKSSTASLAGLTYLKPNIQYEDFSWEAKGVRAGKDAGGMSTFEQTGKFNTLVGKDGEVNFPIPYALAPNVELSGNPAGAVIVVESRPTGFKWKNGGDNAFLHNGEVTWKSKGVGATEIPKP